MPCFWCKATFDCDSPLLKRTDDHVIPASLGGTRCDGNIVLACYSCNQERGSIVGHMKLLKDIAVRGCRSGTLRKIRDKHLVMLDLQKKWRAIERKLLMRSPTAEIDLTFPDDPRVLTKSEKLSKPLKGDASWDAQVAAARRIAEARHFSKSEVVGG